MTIRSLVKRQFLLGPSLVVTAIVLVAALSYRLVQGRLAAFAASFYGSTQSGLYPFLAARVIGYRTFLWVLLGLLGAWCLTLWADPLSKRREASVAARVPASLLWKVFFLVVLVFLATVAVLLSQREWVRFGRPCWDNYCVYSELIASSPAASLVGDVGVRCARSCTGTTTPTPRSFLCSSPAQISSAEWRSSAAIASFAWPPRRWACSSCSSSCGASCRFPSASPPPSSSCCWWPT